MLVYTADAYLSSYFLDTYKLIASILDKLALDRFRIADFGLWNVVRRD